MSGEGTASVPSAASPLPPPGGLRAWLLAARPRTLPVSLAPVLVGTAVASVVGSVRPGPALAAGIGALLLQIGSNLANDVFDFEKGADTEDRIGPPRATQLGLRPARSRDVSPARQRPVSANETPVMASS